MDYVFFLFINQISCILNSYILYGNINNELEVEAYKSYLKALDEFTENGGLYKNLLNVHLLFCKWYDIRIISDTRKSKKRLVKINDIDESKLSNLFRKSEKKMVAYRNVTYDNVKNTERGNYDYFFTVVEKDINNLFKYTLNSNNYSMLIFTSYFQNVEKFNRLYASPIFPILGIPFKTHNGRFYSAIGQVWHDYLHLQQLDKYFKHLYPSKNCNDLNNINSSKKIDDIQVFFEKMLFLLKLDEKKESNNAKHLLWWILHEQQFLDSMRLNNRELPNERNELFFDITKLKSILEKFKNIITSGNKFSVGIVNIGINKNNKHYGTVLSCINLLIQVCNETLDDSNKNKLFKKIQNETIQSYNINNRASIYRKFNKNNIGAAIKKKFNNYLNKHQNSPKSPKSFITLNEIMDNQLNTSRTSLLNPIVNNNNNFKRSVEKPRFNSIPPSVFYERAFGPRNGSPLTNNNFSNQNRNPNNT